MAFPEKTVDLANQEYLVHKALGDQKEIWAHRAGLVQTDDQDRKEMKEKGDSME